MNDTVEQIPLINLSIAFIPVLIVIAILFRWSIGAGTALYAMARMLAQLLLIGYVLAYIFKTNNYLIVLAVLAVMIFASCWIAMRPVKILRQGLYFKALASVALGGLLTLVLVTQAVLTLEPWYLPSKVIPLAGMIFANAMNTVSLAVERFESELHNKVQLHQARHVALRTSLIPATNTLFAVGLVALPGMMTGQILSGVDPLIAVRYQIMVMAMVYGSGGIAAACCLKLLNPPQPLAPTAS